jgi:streptogramin lyase
MNSILSSLQSPGLAKLAATLVTTLIVAAKIAASPFTEGDILYPDSFGAVFALNPATGERRTVASGGSLVQPLGIAVNADGTIFVSDTGSLAIIRIDSLTGSQSVIANGGLIGVPFGIAIDRKGDLLIANGEAIIRLDPLKGEQTIVSAGGHFGSGVGYPLGVAVAQNGDLIVANVGFPSEIIRVNPRTGHQTLLSSGGCLKFPQAIAVDGKDIYLTDVATADGNFGIGAVIHVDLHTGRQTVLSSGGNLVGPVGIAVDENGQIVVGDPW